MKKILKGLACFALCAVLCLPLIACKEKEPQKPVDPTITAAQFKEFYENASVTSTMQTFEVSTTYKVDNVLDYTSTMQLSVDGNNKYCKIISETSNRRTTIYGHNNITYFEILDTVNDVVKMRHKAPMDIFVCIEEGDFSLSRYYSSEDLIYDEIYYVNMAINGLFAIDGEYYTDATRFDFTDEEGVLNTRKYTKVQNGNDVNFGIELEQKYDSGMNEEKRVHALTYSNNRLSRVYFEIEAKSFDEQGELEGSTFETMEIKAYSGTVTLPSDLSIYPDEMYIAS